MNNYLFCCVLLGLAIQGPLQSDVYSSPIYPIFDVKEFRLRASKNIENEAIHFPGLDRLSVSASAQFSKENLTKIASLVSVFSEELVIIDLREESHGFINGIAVSWVDDVNEANKGKTLLEVEEDEARRLEEAFQNKTILIGSPGYEETIEVYDVQTEQELVEGRGFHYIRLPVTDHEHPSDEVMERFIQIIKALSPNHWIHLHCRAGRGRTTTFFALMDIALNAEDFKLEEILARQHAIGGKDLTIVNKEGKYKPRAAARLDLLERFYRYCKEYPQFQVTWHEFIMFSGES